MAKEIMKETVATYGIPSQQLTAMLPPVPKFISVLSAGSEEMEKYRLERKRERNRIAATKCR